MIPFEFNGRERVIASSGNFSKFAGKYRLIRSFPNDCYLSTYHTRTFQILIID